jgi:DNA-binding CsgD family transcriptional regulator
MVNRPRIESPIDELTPREREVLALMAEGRFNQRSRTRSSSPSAPSSAK